MASVVGAMAMTHSPGLCGWFDAAPEEEQATAESATAAMPAHLEERRADAVHHVWDNSLHPRLTIDPGDTVIFNTRDAADNYYTQDSTAENAAKRGPFKGHPLTGPIKVRGSQLGDVLAVHIAAMELASWFGWTAVRPGRGLLPAEEVRATHLQIWDLSDGKPRACGNATTSRCRLPRSLASWGRRWRSRAPVRPCRPGPTAAIWITNI